MSYGQNNWAPYGDPSEPPSPSGLHTEMAHYVSLRDLVRPESSASNISSQSSGFATQISYHEDAPPTSSAAVDASRARGAAWAAAIRSGAFDDGQPLDPELQTPATHHRYGSAQLTNPSRRQHNDRGRMPRSLDPGATATPSNMQIGQNNATRTRSAPGHRPPPIRTDRLPNWYRNCKMPTFKQAMLNMPFTDPCNALRVKPRGVIKLEGVSYRCTKHEIHGLVGPTAEVMHMPEGSTYLDVHIIMDRSTGKSGCAFVIVSTPQEAFRLVSAMQHRATSPQGLKMGGRDIKAEVASPEQLMAALFLHATDVEWSGFTPRIIRSNDGAASSSFNGFCSSEELAMMAKNAEDPTRSKFVVNVRFRIYECMISTLHKFPWHASHTITLGARMKLYETALVCIRSIAATLDDVLNQGRGGPPGLTIDLFQELVVAVLGCPGFSEQQKASIVHVLDTLGYRRLTTGWCLPQSVVVTFGGTGPSSAKWPFLALSPKVLVSNELLQFYATLISKATGTVPNILQPFGNLSINYGNGDLSSYSIAEIAKIERDAVAVVFNSQ